MSKYAPFGRKEALDNDHDDNDRDQPTTTRSHSSGKVSLLCAFVLALSILWFLVLRPSRQPFDDLTQRYVHHTPLSRYWGQYSPYFGVHSEIPHSVPDQCNITFVQVLSRHGARYPTAKAGGKYSRTIEKVHKASHFRGQTAFLADYRYSLGIDRLTTFGERQMFEAGRDFVSLYPRISHQFEPFIRASGADRVVQSAEYWARGFREALDHAADVDHAAEVDSVVPYPVLVMPEEPGFNNTLTHGLCANFELGDYAFIGSDARNHFARTFVPPLRRRLNRDMPGAGLDLDDVIHLFEMCPFTAVAGSRLERSQFCSLFSPGEFLSYDYFATLGKYYGYGAGNPLGPTQGVGFVNELIARLNQSAVQDWTSTNHTLTGHHETFPLNASIYADFTHDSVMTGIIFAMGLYSDLELLSNTTSRDRHETLGYASATTIPFAGRIFIEKMTCHGNANELVRVVVNGRIVPLMSCASRDNLGRCRLQDYLASLSFARNGGRWDECWMAETEI